MGHIRLGTLPKTREWKQVVAMLARGAAAPELAAAVAVAAEEDLNSARGDAVLSNTVWLLTQLPLAARTDRFAAELTSLGFVPGSELSLTGILTGFSRAVDSQVSGKAGLTDLGELAREAATESLATLIGDQLSTLFGASPEDLRIELGKFATRQRFAALAREFFARLTFKTLDYYVSRVLANHVGPGRTFATLSDQTRFQHALELHCRETSLIVEAFAGGWFSKANYEGRLTPEGAQGFTDYALRKMRDELRARRADDA